MGLFDWWHTADDRAHRAFTAAALGWMLDAFDVMLFSLLLASIIESDLNLSKEQGGVLGSITLVAAAAGV